MWIGPLILLNESPRSKHLIEQNNQRHGHRRVELGLDDEAKDVSPKGDAADGLLALDLGHRAPLIVVDGAATPGVGPFHAVYRMLGAAAGGHVSEGLGAEEMHVLLDGEPGIDGFFSVVHQPLLSKAQFLTFGKKIKQTDVSNNTT